MDKLEHLLDMTEHPEHYTERQIQDLLADEDVRKHYDVIVWLREAYAEEIASADNKSTESRSQGEKTPRHLRSAANTMIHAVGFRFRKVAAIFLVALLCGLTYAAYRAFSSAVEHQPTKDITLNPQPSTFNSSPADGLVLFADIRLDSMLVIVGKHYGKAVFFGNEQLKGLRIHTKWNQEDSLAAFIENLNELDGLQLTELRDTIFVQKGGAQ